MQQEYEEKIIREYEEEIMQEYEESIKKDYEEKEMQELLYVLHAGRIGGKKNDGYKIRRRGIK